GNDDEDPDNGDGDQGGCTDVGNFVFSESNGLVNVEFENAVFSESWEERSTGTNFSGDGYMVWTGNQFLGQPGNGLATFSIEINNPGTYQFLWRSAVTTGNNGTEHNDTWLRFGDADDFFAQNGNSIVYPKGSGKTPNPEGGGADGWFKVYRSGNDLDFKWQARTFDNNAHNIFVTFNEAGVYTMEISARSSGHAIDRFVLFNSSFNQSDAVSDGNELSAISCN
ncbi:MAG: hypothetical protein AAFZ89_12840, partial [Bacteroidota bacterium]